MARPICIAPSILSADFAALGAELASIEEAGADWVHVDVMDGHFVPNLTIGPPVVRSLRRHTRLPLDVHLMIEDPGRYLDAFVEAGADTITFHVEAVSDPGALVDRIHAAGRRAGVALSPETPPGAVLEAAEVADLVLVMTVHPGFGGQTFLAGCVDKLIPIVERDRRGIDLEVDGGLNPETVRACAAAGANVIVAGHAVFRSPDRRGAIRALRENAERARGKET
ncbi:MAG: ribulose-phosphate 3-epimerase [Planctomycetes bacterium]|nr:ribulose-phosphate 3-epimerase [Planctomycetota bacterium]